MKIIFPFILPYLSCSVIVQAADNLQPFLNGHRPQPITREQNRDVDEGAFEIQTPLSYNPILERISHHSFPIRISFFERPLPYGIHGVSQFEVLLRGKQSQAFFSFDFEEGVRIEPNSVKINRHRLKGYEPPFTLIFSATEFPLTVETRIRTGYIENNIEEIEPGYTQQITRGHLFQNKDGNLLTLQALRFNLKKILFSYKG